MMPRTTLHEMIAKGLALFAILLLSSACGEGGTEPDNLPEPPVETQIVAGDDQVRLPGSVLVTELEVQAVDASGAPTAQEGLAVTWTPVSGGGSLDEMGALTDASGKARARWRLGPALGDQALDVAVSGTPAVTFTARAVEAGPILFASGRAFGGGLFTMNADGSDVVEVTRGRIRGSARSPDGSTIVFEEVGTGVTPMLISLPGLARSAFGFQNEDAGGFVWSPDGAQLGMTIWQLTGGCTERSIWVFQADGSTPTKLTDSEPCTHNRLAGWSPDGSVLAFENHPEGEHSTAVIWTMGADGAGAAPVLGSPVGHQPRWLPDGRRVVVGGFESSLTNSLRVLDTETGDQETVWSPVGATQVLPGGVSPDGRFAVAEVVLDGADNDVYRIDLDTGEAVNLSNRSTGFDAFPSWWAGTP